MLTHPLLYPLCAIPLISGLGSECACPDSDAELALPDRHGAWGLFGCPAHPSMAPQAYFDLAESLKMPILRTCMTIHLFRQRTKLDVNKNLMCVTRIRK